MQSTSIHASATVAIHGGQAPDPSTGAIVTPIFQSTTFVQEAVGKHKGYTYSRSGNPTVAAFERQLAALEGTRGAVAFGTGMSALTGVCLAMLEAGDHVVCGDAVYGGTLRLLRRVLAGFGVRSTSVDTSDLVALAAAFETRTRLLIVETPANPTLKLTDIEAVARIARRAGARLLVDNTFLTPVLQRPFALGADIVVHSTTKYIEGHNTTVGGAVVTDDAEFLEKLRFVQNAVGTIQSPFEAFLTSRGLKTLPLRMGCHGDHALRVARFLESHPSVATVRYPFLESFPQYDLARRQQLSGGGIVAFEVQGGVEAGIAVMNAVELCALAENLGSVETLITHPASMTHASMPPEDRVAAGISDGLIRLSVGLEDPDDVIADLAAALEGRRAGKGGRS